MPFRFAIFVLLTCSFLLPILGAVPPWQKADVPRFVSSAELVSVPVVVTNNGQHLYGLGEQKFLVSEDGVPQRLASFEEISSTASPPQPHKLDDRTFSNMFAAEQQAPNVVVFLIDLINTSPAKQGHAREGLVRFLTSRVNLREPTMLAVMKGTELLIIHDFTDDPAVLVAAVKRIRSSIDAKLGVEAQTGQDDLASFASAVATKVADEVEIEKVMARFEMMDRVDRGAQQRHEADRTLLTLHLLQQLAQALAGVPGRKTLIWATEGVTFFEGTQKSVLRGMTAAPDTPDMALAVKINTAFDRTWDSLASSNIAVYPVDLAEVLNPAFRDARYASPASISLGEGTLRNQAMNGFTDRTGGGYCQLESRIENCYRRAVDDSAHYYLLSYYANKRGRLGWRKIQVRVDETGAHVRARTGYFARSGSAWPSTDPVLLLQDALRSPLHYTGVRFLVRWGANAATMEAARLQFELELPPDSILARAGQDQFRLKLMVAGIRANGGLGWRLAKNIEARPQLEELEKLRARGLFYRDWIEVSPKDDLIRFAVLDEVSGRIGTVTAKLPQRQGTSKP